MKQTSQLLILALTMTPACFSFDLDSVSDCCARLMYNMVMDQAQAALKPTFQGYQSYPDIHQLVYAGFEYGRKSTLRGLQYKIVTRPWYHLTVRDYVIAGVAATVVGTAAYLCAKHRSKFKK